MQGVSRNIELRADIGNGVQLRGARDFNIGALIGHVGYPLQSEQDRSYACKSGIINRVAADIMAGHEFTWP